MKKKFLVILVSSVMGLQLIGCENSDNIEKTSNSESKHVVSNVVDNDSINDDIAEVYLDVREEYLEVIQTKEMNEWNEAKSEAIKDLKDIKKMIPMDDENANQAISDVEQLIDKYEKALKGKDQDVKEIQNLEAQVKQLLFGN